MMKPIYEFQTIQVEMTNACVHECSNCTRFCGHHTKPFFMEWPTFRRAIDSLENWPRLIGIMGGEPTLHPDFRRFVEYAAQKHPMRYNVGGGHKPIKSLSKYMYDMIALKTHPLNQCQGLGLWSSVCGTYYKHYETIQDKFIYQCINDHTASSRHQAWLLTRKEFDISDEDWIKMRDNCWWQRWLGSPSITPKGAFFCEVAAAMDMLFDGPGGWPIEKDWWKRTPDDFGSQLKWCEMCAGAFTSFDRDANEQVDDVSPVMYEKLKLAGSPKLKRSGAIKIHNVGKESDIEVKPRDYMLMYQTDPELRFTDKNKALYPAHISAVYFVKDLEKIDAAALRESMKSFERTTIVCTLPQAREYFTGWENVTVFDKDLPFGKQVWLATRADKEWIAVFKIMPNNMPDDFRQKINRTIFNPGTMHYFPFVDMLFFHKGAQAFAAAGFEGVGRCKNAEELVKLWPQEKYCQLDEKFDEIINDDIEEWEENIRLAGIMEWNNLRPTIDTLIVRRRVEPQIEEICNGGERYNDKLRQFASLQFPAVAQAKMCNKIKTAVQNETAKELLDNDYDLDKVKVKLRSDAMSSFCHAYALALLSSGEERRAFLKQCIADEANIYGLGVATLRNLHLRSKAENSQPMFGELLDLMKNTPGNVLLGNRYVGKSLAMILTRLGMPPVCFCDDERQGYDYENLHTYRADDILAKGEKYSLVVCVKGRLRQQIMDAAMPFVDTDTHIVELSEHVYGELAGSPNLANLGINLEVLGKEMAKDCTDAKERCLLSIE